MVGQDFKEGNAGCKEGWGLRLEKGRKGQSMAGPAGMGWVTEQDRAASFRSPVLCVALD